MATIKLYLGASKKDRVNVRVRVRDGRMIDLYYTSDILIKPEYWDEKQQNVKSRISINSTEKTELIRKIQELKRVCEKAYDDLKHSADSIISDNFVRCVERQIYPERYAKSDFFAVWDKFLQAKSNLSFLGQRALIQCKDNLVRFEKYMQTFKDRRFVLSFNSINDIIIQEYYYFIINEYQYISNPAMQDFYTRLECRQWKTERHINTANGRIKKFRTFWLWAIKSGYTEKNPFNTFTIPTDRYATPIFLLPEEVKKIYSLDLSANVYLEKARDIFVFQCMVGCRREDLWSLTRDNIQDGVLSYIPKKTIESNQKTLRVPLNSIAIEILEKYKDEEKPLPLDCSMDYYNRAITQIAYKAGLDRKVTVFNTKGLPEIKELKEVLTSHIARKTFISILINNGVAPQVISSMSGHTANSKAFARYFEIEDDIKKAVVRNLEI
ncbi:MAG: integrase catalytic domain-containing protein [Bacteroidales bacterium]|nr:integrase catalytic domain-containing protein [Bacteroidales bacterium]